MSLNWITTEKMDWISGRMDGQIFLETPTALNWITTEKMDGRTGFLETSMALYLKTGGKMDRLQGESLSNGQNGVVPSSATIQGKCGSSGSQRSGAGR